VADYCKSKNKDFQILIHEGQYFFDKSLWEYHLKGYNKIRKSKTLIDDISFMPPTYIEVCEFDCLHDEGVALSKRLNSLNIECVLHKTYNTMHGYDICFKHPKVVSSFKERINFMKR
jgi:acetyl esterase